MTVTKQQQLKVGLFVAIALIIAVLIIFLLGSQTGVFDRKVSYYTSFRDIEGLRPGSRVLLAGLNAGNVTKTELTADGSIRVSLDVERNLATRITPGSLVTIGSKGMLGDKLVHIALGPPGIPIPPGSELMSEEPVPLSTYLSRAGHIMASVEKTSDNLNRITAVFASDAFLGNITESAEALGQVSRSFKSGDGLLPKLLDDSELATRTASLIENANQMAKRAEEAMGEVASLVRDVHRSDSMVHALLLGDDGDATVAAFAGVAKEASDMLATVRSQPSAVHSLLFDAESANLVHSIDNAAASLESVLAKVDRGEGTIGALISDPSLYEDLKRLVGELERNRILKFLVRHSLQQDNKPAD